MFLLNDRALVFRLHPLLADGEKKKKSIEYFVEGVPVSAEMFSCHESEIYTDMFRDVLI